jgi:hypothetical protein
MRGNARRIRSPFLNPERSIVTRTPNPQQVQEIAAGLIEDNGRRTRGIVTGIYDRVTWELNEEDRKDEDYVEAVCAAVESAIESAMISATWPSHGFATAGDRQRFLAMFGDQLDTCFTPEFAAYVRQGLPTFGTPELQHRLIGVSGEAHTPTERDLAHPDQWLPEVLHEVRDVYPTPWRAADQPSTPNGAS